MNALLLKDLRIQMPTIVFSLVYPVLLIGMFSLIADDGQSARYLFLLCSVIMPYMIVLGSFKEYKNGSERLIMTLPVTRADVANGKFLLLALAAAISTAVAALSMGLFSLFGRWGLISGNFSVRLRDLMPVASGVLTFSFLIPLYIRFGFRAMRMALVGVMVLGVILQLVLVITAALGDRSVFALIDALVRWHASVGFLRWNLGLAGIALGIFTLSFALTHRIMARKDF
jgi:ABC-type transport system involved in multi-copper enzyme maturation permease subunit